MRLRETAVLWVVYQILGGALPARAGTPIEETVSASPDGHVRIDNLSGTVRIEGWDRDEISITGTLGDGAEGVDVDRDENEVVIEVVLPSRSRNVDATDLEIRVPRRSSLGVGTVSAGVEILGVEGSLEIETVSGTIGVHGSGGPLEARSVSGAIDAAGEFSRVEAETVSGDIVVEDARGALVAGTTSGEIDVRGGVFDEVRCSSLSGPLRFEGSPSDGADWEIENFSGPTLLVLPGDVNVHLDVEVFSGSLRNDFGGELRRPEHGPGGSLSTTIGSGDPEAEISVNSFSGSVEIQRK